jgi:hypothetical protein
MRHQCLFGTVLAAIFACGQLALAQPSAVPTNQTSTTGMVGFTTNQTARLNVLNLNPVTTASATPTPPNCFVELRFFDAQNNMVNQSVVPNFAPGTATFLDLERAAVTSQTSPRAEIRGVVVVNPAPTPVDSPALTGFCSVMVTLEIIDATGSTVVLTSETRMVGGPLVMPLARVVR